jgi:hypothetical protein
MDEMLQSGSAEQIVWVTKAFLAINKSEVAELERAYAGTF